MGNRIEKTTTIEIAGLPVIFYKMANADIFIDTQNVDNVFGIPLDPKIPFVTLYNASIKNDVLAYPIDIIVDNLSEDRLRYFAKTGIVNLLDNSPSAPYSTQCNHHLKVRLHLSGAFLSPS